MPQTNNSGNNTGNNTGNTIENTSGNNIENLTTIKNDRVPYLSFVNATTHITGTKYQLNQKDFARLAPGKCLDDIIITAYVNLLNAHYTNYYCVSTHQATHIAFLEHQDTDKWLNYKSILFPVNTPGHWILVEFNFFELVVYDSQILSSALRDQSVLDIQRFIKKKLHLEVPIKMSRRVTNAFKQNDMCSCGVFVLMYAKSIVSNREFMKIDKNNFRNRVVHELLTNTIIYSNDTLY